jgi:uncharacterized iron-regulated membrane protein
VAVTGFLLAVTEFFGEDEALREATRALASPVHISASAADWVQPIALAAAGANRIAPGAPVDKIEVQFKGKQPTVTVFTGRITGGEDRKLVFDARTGALLKNEDYVDKPFLNRLHSGEAFGDGGLVVAMFWAVALAIMSVTGFYIYLTMRGHRVRTGLKRVFW